MDYSSIKGRYSLSTTNLTNPIAESTCLNGASSRSKFNWGEGKISPRNNSHRNNSNSIVDQSNSNSKSSNGLPTKDWMSPISRIDPRTYVDIHSNGLASRIVKYHDNSARLNRSLSMNNLYNKPGQFPVVHLKKNEQQYKAKKTKTLSMTRIAAPEKSAFHGNTLSSILRSGSIVGLQKSDEEISRENRPILHPPPSENDMAPTRSVLEVLKEISRKRINSDEMDGTELTKKQCKEPEQDSTSNAGPRSQSKRQREITSSTALNAQISPEQQVIKKRMCNYNNDILSSLSSSMVGVTKRKMFEMQSPKRTASELAGSNHAARASFSDFSQTRQEKHRCIGSAETQQSAVGATSAHQPSPSIQSSNELDGDARCAGIVTRRSSEPVLNRTKPKVTLFNRDYDESPVVQPEYDENKEEGDLCGIQFVKPKKSSSISSGGSLLMEKTKKSKLALMLSGLKGELDEEEDEVDAVPPKKDEPKPVVASVSTQSSLSSTIATPTTASAAIPTQPLIPTCQTVSTDTASKPVPSLVSSGLKLNSSTLAPITSTAPTVSQPQPTPVLPEAAVKTVTTTVATPATTTSNPIAGGFSFGLLNDKSKTAPTPAVSAVSQAPALTLTTSTPAALPSTGTIPVTEAKPFTFGAATSQQPPTTSSAPGFTFGSSTVPSTNGFTIASSSAPTTTKAADATPAPAPALAVFGSSSTASATNFTFGSLAAPKTTAINSSTTATTSLATTTSALTPSFGSLKNTWSSSTTPASSTPGLANSMNGIAAFGAGNPPTLPQTTTNSTTGGFSFGLSTPATEAPKSVFGSLPSTTTTAAPTSNTTFNFSANKTPPNPTNSISAFTFGAAPSNPTSTPAAAAPNTTITFGASAAPSNVFGNPSNTKPSNTFTFVSSAPTAAVAPAPTQNNAFSFSASADKTTNPAAGNSVGGFSFNNPATNFTPIADSSKNIFGTVAAAPASTGGDPKPAFNFGASSASNPSTDKPVVFGAASNIFGSPAPAPAQNTTFTFGTSSNGGAANQNSTAAPSLFGTVSSSTNLPAPTNTMFGAAQAAPNPNSTFNFGSTTSNSLKPEASKPSGGFVFGSSSSLGSNTSKPAVDMNKTFVFGDTGTTTIKPVLPSSTSASVFGGGNATNSGINGAAENKVFSFGAAPAAGNNTFNAGGQPAAVNPAPAFNFGSVAPANNVVPGKPQDRVIKKATRRLHKT